MTETNVQIYSVYISAPAQKVWEAITQGKHSPHWGYGGEVEYDLRAGGAFQNKTTEAMRAMGMGDIAVSGTVVKADPPRELVLEWSPAWHADREPTRVTWELTEYPGEVTKVTLTHDLSKAPDLGAEFAGGSDPAGGGGGWPWVLSDLKSYVETGSPMAGEAS